MTDEETMMRGIKLDSAWAGVLACAVIPAMTLWQPSFGQWRMMMLVALLLTVLMLFNQRMRHYVLLPSCLALASVLAAISVRLTG
ncbi:membrane protein [Pantoea stewartii]|uniref:DUF1435 domain-containing protein n=2 Tax=Pantoea stewartii subsp. stewartii DC283 TaxID=660596 RepID=A0ABM6K2K4_PANSE|nr:hypothetical protein DSJ_04420 [Pantoea stewartii subsp. stewartii DC283]KGD83204.1 membrane protein [Pantoea stewartii subsp. indologenes]KHE01741.1 membrane protein [Pantoea stewartii]KKW50532.1 membrane protein [Pantoea ananatis]KHN64341.1 membrane protein [Pantoea stewartii]